MARRLGIIFWWLGALMLGVGVLGALEGMNLGGWIFLGLITALCWGLSFLLSGSFWKPAK